MWMAAAVGAIILILGFLILMPLVRLSPGDKASEDEEQMAFCTKHEGEKHKTS